MILIILHPGNGALGTIATAIHSVKRLVTAVLITTYGGFNMYGFLIKVACNNLQPFNPLALWSDQYIDSPDNFNTRSSRQVRRVKKIINLGI